MKNIKTSMYVVLKEVKKTNVMIDSSNTQLNGGLKKVNVTT
jgi:hypothetical protein